MQQRFTLSILAVILLLLGACRPELEDEDGALKVSSFRLEPIPDTIVEGNYTEPPCINNIDKNFIQLDFPEKISEINVVEQTLYTNIVAQTSYSNPDHKITLRFAPDSLPMVRRNYSLTNNSNPDEGTCYLYLEVDEWTYNEYRPAEGKGSVHFYRKENGGFKVQICDAKLLREGGSGSEFSFKGWIEQ